MGLTPFFPLYLQAQVKQVFNHSIWEKNWLLGSKLADVAKQKLTQVVGQLSTILAKKDFHVLHNIQIFLEGKVKIHLSLS